MSDDLKSRLRSVGGVRHDGATRWYINPDGPEAADRIEKLEADLEVATMKRLLDSDRIEKLEAALREIEEASVPRTVAIRWRSNGSPSKHDKCAHGMAMYEDCGNCIADFARKALEGKDD